MEIARAEGSRASTSLRSISSIPIHSDLLEKVPSWLDENGCDKKTTKFGEEVSRIALASVPIKPKPDPLPHTTQMSHLAPKTAQPTMVKDGTSASQFAPNAASAKMQMDKTFQQHVQFGNFEPPNQPMLSNQMRSGTLPPPVAPSAKYSASIQIQFATTRNEAVSLPASLPKLKLAEFPGDSLEWPEWSGLFLSTVHAANIDASLKMNHLKTLVTGKAKEVIAGLGGYTGDMYDIAWNTLVTHFGRPQVVVNAQSRRIYTFPQVKAYDSVALVKYSRTVSSCVQVLTQMNYVGDLQSEGVLSSATRKLPMNMKTKWLAHARQNANYYMRLEAFSLWLQEVAAVQENVLMTGNPNADKPKWTGKDKPKVLRSQLLPTTVPTRLWSRLSIERW